MSMSEVPPLRRTEAEAPGALESRLDALARTVLLLEDRVAVLEGAALEVLRPRKVVFQEVPPPPIALPAEVLPNPVRLMGLVGRVCLILGGATLIRALVDAGSIQRDWGVALGLAYALTWILLADRAKSKLEAAFHALASILIAYPLLVESSARFGILTPDLAALLLLAVTVLHGAVAWRRDLQPIIWTATLASLGSGLALMAALRAIEPFLAVLLLLGIGSLWLTYGRKWHGLRWPFALAADLGVLILTSLAVWPGGTPEAYRGITPGWAMLLALALVLGYLGSFALRMLRRHRAVNAFEITQTVLVLLLGFGGALRVGLAAGFGVGLLGAGAVFAGVGCYAAAIPFAEELEETRANFNFFTFLALIFLLLGGPIVLPRSAFAALGGLLGLGAMLAGLRLRRTVLLLQSGLYLGAAAVASGLAAWTFRAFLGTAGPVTAIPFAGLLVLACLAGTLALFLLRRRAESIQAPILAPFLAKVRPLILLLGALSAAGFGALAIRTGILALSPGPADAGMLAVVRTAVLAGLAILLAWSGRRLPGLNLRWLVYPLLIVTALKFLFEDLAVGRPMTLFLGFMCFGTTLILAPRLLKAPTTPDGDGAPNSSLPEVDP